MSSIEKLVGFFKKNTLSDVEKLEDVLSLNLETLTGISPVHAKNLAELGLISVKDLAQISDEKKIIFTRQIEDLPEAVLDKWIRTTTMIFDYCTKAVERKIILLGLDNAGKTSILSILQKKFSIIKNLLPTRGVSRQTLDFLGLNVICWDFGGQVAYRNMYLSRPDLFLESDLLIFCIDVLDVERYDEALEYLFRIMKVIKDLDEIAPIIIDMHKFDPDVQDSEDLLKKRAELIDRIATEALQMNFACTFINTTIFIKESVEELFSLAIQKMAASSSMIEYIIKDYMAKIDARAISLMTNHNLIISSYSKDSRLETGLLQTGLLLQALVDYYEKTGMKKEKEFYIYLKENDITIQTVKLFDHNNAELSLWAVFEGKDKEFKDIAEFKKTLEPIVDLF
jgi:GTPase SAR1 family protein